jgi:transcriptional regulator with XRE-family HTH domain
MNGAEFKKLRQKLKHSQQSMADALRLQVRQIIRYEKEESHVPYSIELVLKNGLVKPRDESEVGRWPSK